MTSRYPFPSHPSGWFVVAFSDELPAGAVLVRHYFGQDIVLYRTRDGQACAVDPHCPHLGAHLGHGGRVEEDRLRCPFHGWCFDGHGRCVEVPGAARVPPRAALRAWPLRERNGTVFVYHDASGAAPGWEPPVLPEEEWSRDYTVLWTLRTHPQEVFENTVDTAHLRPVHGAEGTRLLREPAQDGPRLQVSLRFTASGESIGMPGTSNDVALDVTLHGLGCGVVQTHVLNVGVRARQRIYPTPIDGERIDLRGVINVARLPDPALTEQVGELFHQAYVTDFARDFPIWENKCYLARPLLSSDDGPIPLYRRWAGRFYMERPCS